MWDDIGSGLVSIALGGGAIAFGALLIFLGKKLWDRLFGKQPDFVITRRPGGWAMERTKRSIAYSLARGEGAFGTTNVSAIDAFVGNRYGDVEPGAIVEVGGSDQLWLTWVDGHRRLTRMMVLGSGDRYEVFGRKTKPGQPAQT